MMYGQKNIKKREKEFYMAEGYDLLVLKTE
jgi:hypothetical protein